MLIYCIRLQDCSSFEMGVRIPSLLDLRQGTVGIPYSLGIALNIAPSKIATITTYNIVQIVLECVYAAAL